VAGTRLQDGPVLQLPTQPWDRKARKGDGGRLAGDGISEAAWYMCALCGSRRASVERRTAARSRIGIFTPARCDSGDGFQVRNARQRAGTPTAGLRLLRGTVLRGCRRRLRAVLFEHRQLCPFNLRFLRRCAELYVAGTASFSRQARCCLHLYASCSFRPASKLQLRSQISGWGRGDQG
jgi:hypothetical protein